jgi:hypothetical protein
MAPITVAAERHPIFCTSTDVELPNVELPNVELPNVELPNVELPNVELPAATRALVHRSSLVEMSRTHAKGTGRDVHT